ncbi:hypothetical protein pb186bvf_016353 [Paramecium bursaria]
MQITIVKCHPTQVFQQIEDHIEDEIIHFRAINCNLLDIPKLNMDTIKVLDVSFNRIQQAVILPKYLVYLNLSFNQINYINNVKLGMFLEYLSLIGNKVTLNKNYRTQLIKQLYLHSPNIQYLDNLIIDPIFKDQPQIPKDKCFEEITGYNFEDIQ